ncbi:hypothetical protein KKH16_00245 [Patescibacteria group bacterium]|nr:hypothetical protein [Patescibacteria group bacterium]
MQVWFFASQTFISLLFLFLAAAVVATVATVATVAIIVAIFIPFIFCSVFGSCWVLYQANLSQLKQDKKIFENVSCFQEKEGVKIVFKDVKEKYIRNFYKIKLSGETIVFAATKEKVKIKYTEAKKLQKAEERKEKITKTSLLEIFVPTEIIPTEIILIARHTFQDYQRSIPVLLPR